MKLAQKSIQFHINLAIFLHFDSFMSYTAPPPHPRTSHNSSSCICFFCHWASCVGGPSGKASGPRRLQHWGCHSDTGTQGTGNVMTVATLNMSSKWPRFQSSSPVSISESCFLCLVYLSLALSTLSLGTSGCDLLHSY